MYLTHANTYTRAHSNTFVHNTDIGAGSINEAAENDSCILPAFSVMLLETDSVDNLSVQFSSRWYLCARKSLYVLHPVSQKFPQRCL